jgi:hypothetical protein
MLDSRLTSNAFVVIVRSMRQYSILLIGLLSLSACASPEAALPQGIAQAAPVATFVTATPRPTISIPETGTPPPQNSAPEATLILPTLTAYPDDRRFSLGQSVEGRDIWAWQFGEGPRTIVLIGGIHGGFEGNTVVLAEELVDYFRRHLNEVLSGVRLVIIPAANPDGLLRGSELEGRFNARGVDLNRNWGCEWSETAVLRDVEVDPGPRPFSEPETVALRMYFIAEPPDAVLFYHSAAGGIFPGQCGDTHPSTWLGELLETATGYPHGQFGYYEVSGDATNWLAERGIPAVVIETYSKEETDFNINLDGVMALQCHFALEETGDDQLDPAIRRHCR